MSRKRSGKRPGATGRKTPVAAWFPAGYWMLAWFGPGRRQSDWRPDKTQAGSPAEAELQLASEGWEPEGRWRRCRSLEDVWWTWLRRIP